MSIVLSARQAEDANRDLAKIARTGNSGLMLVPVEAKGAVTGGTKTPRIHLSKAGEFLTKPVPTPGAGSSSGAPRHRVSSVPGQRRPDAASSRAPPPPAVPGIASVTQNRSKRPKSTGAPQRNSYGGAETSEKHKALVPCKRLLNELMKHQCAWPFLKPVDPLAVPGYYDVIKDVIDLGTIKKRLEANQYDDIEEFESEVKRVWGNCYKFNQDPNADIYKMAKTLEDIFDEKMQSVPRDGDGGEASEQMKKMRKEMMQMQKQMQQQQKLMQQQSALQSQSMQMQMVAAPPVPAAARRQSTGGGGRRGSAGGGTAQQNALAALQNGEMDLGEHTEAVAKVVSPDIRDWHGNWKDVEANVDFGRTPEYRNQVVDDEGRGLVFNWFICDWKEEVQPRRPRRNGSMALQIVPTAFQQIEESARPRSPGPERKSRPMLVSVAPIKCTDELDDGSVLELRVDCRWSWRFTWVRVRST